MTSTFLSKFLPARNGEPSIYETLQLHDETGRELDQDGHSDGPTQDSPFNSPYQDDDGDLEALQTATRRPGSLNRSQAYRAKASSAGKELEDADDDVPQSLLIENDAMNARKQASPHATDLPPPVPGPSTDESQAQWHTTRQQQQLHPIPVPQSVHKRHLGHKGRPLGISTPREQAAWMWANVSNLDGFLAEVYDYYVEHGFWSILLGRVLRMLTIGFIVIFSIVLTQCIDYKKIPESKELSQILIPKCTRGMSGIVNIVLWLFAFFWIFKMFDYARDIRRLRSMQVFYRYLLEIPDSDMQTISWQEVVKKLMDLREDHLLTANAARQRHAWFFNKQSKHRMDAHDIANRLMRKENYLIGLINKDILDFTVPLPFIRGRQLLSRTLEWYLQYCVLDFVFTDEGQVNPLFLKDEHRDALIKGFRQRFVFAGFMSVLCAPISVAYFMLYYFFRYFNEYQRNPSQIGSRQYTPFARWKFREFNELPHLFERRVNMSYPFAARYIDQFPKDKTIQLSSFVALIAGALASVLAVASLVDPESFLSFELTPERTVLFYLGVFGSIWAVARGAMPEDNLVFDPEYALSNVTEYTHYLPKHWKGRLHTNEVRQEFAYLYRMKLLIFFEELLSIICAPYLLWVSLPASSDRLVDFFREFTIQVDGMGYVCSFAVFDFKKGGGGETAQLDQDAARDLREEYYSTKDGKMLASYYGFIDNYVKNQRPGPPSTQPNARGSFHVPPSFPGLMSTSPAHDVANGRASRVDRSKPARTFAATGNAVDASTVGMQASSRRGLRFAPPAAHTSPVASILLDPHHQPSSSHLHRHRNPGHFPRPHTLRTPLEHTNEDAEEPRTEAVPRDRIEGTSDADNESDLDDSWKVTQAAMQDDRERHGDGALEDKGPGVLGLAYQFSKAQTERRPGVNI